MEQKELGKKKRTTVFGSKVYLRQYEHGIMLKIKGAKEWLTLTNGQAASVVLELRNLCENPRLYTERQVADILKASTEEQ